MTGTLTAPAPRAMSARVGPRLLWTLTALALLATLALGATRGRDWWQERQVDKAHAAALAAGRQLAINFTTLDYRTVDADANRVKAGATGDFLASYTSSWANLKSLVVQNKTVSKVQTAEAALESGDLDSAQVIVGVVAPTSNSSIPAGESKTYRMKLGLRLVGSQWKVESLDFVG
jgi:Mce-associated membrane protein